MSDTFNFFISDEWEREKVQFIGLTKIFFEKLLGNITQQPSFRVLVIRIISNPMWTIAATPAHAASYMSSMANHDILNST